MIIVYMGTPEFAVPPLEALFKAGHDVRLVVTQPDRMKDRKGKLQSTPVKKRAIELGVAEADILQPQKIRDNDEFMTRIKSIRPDAIIVAAYGRILPPELLAIPRWGCINIHASLLPKYRGPSPIQQSIIQGDEFTGISIMYMDEGLDTGDILAMAKIEIDRKNAEQLQSELSEIGAGLLTETLPAIESGAVQRKKQDDSESTYTHIIKKNEGCVDFNKSPEEIERLIRGLHPWPGAYTFLKGVQIKILEAETIDSENPVQPGTVTSIGTEGIDVSAGGRTLRIRKLQPAGKKAMTADEYLRGNRMEPGIVLECGKDDI